ncbi:LIPOPROTEIN [Mycoplasmopsis pulmonis]|uniref:LIPOPROTEIN n=1 Tax=Mycoplasmopsis pulmonis (strain UAB CTIP) TaxID=272635 RepID=Q98QM3_MYCPU|nr:hypothetical protein [Mycoplasmopsis pulmonis]MDZ7293297.1 hypothetical protein [Mycoplasmopsis pulmonis]CAC13511.1 LIPOPROTEIN [Mycoplasmopsis pulmonis]
MKTKKLKYLFFASLLTLSFSTMISCSAEIKQGEADNKNKQNNETKNNIPDETKNDQSNSIKKNLNLENWIDDIKDSAQNEHPSFFITWRAAQIYIASFISMIAQLEMMKKSGDNQQFNDVILLTSDLENKYKKTIENKEEQKFDFKKLLDDYGDVLKSIDSQENFSKDSRFLLMNDFEDLKLKDENGNIKKYSYTWKPNSVEELQNWLKPYLDRKVEKFDFYIPDIVWMNMPIEIQRFVIERANKIVLFSDGNAQQIYFMNQYYFENFAQKNNIWPSKDELKKAWEDIQKNKTKEAFEKYDHRLFFQLEDKIKVYNFDPSYVGYFDKRYKNQNAKFKIHKSPLSHRQLSFGEKIDENFVKNYEGVLKVKDQKFDEFIVHNKNFLDTKKKNLVFLGSSLFRHTSTVDRDKLRLETNTDLARKNLDEVHKIFEAIKIKYDPNKYNYIFKLHPYYKNNESKHYVNLITNNFDKPIILESEIPWEFILESEYIALGKNNSVLFDKNDFKDKNNSSKTTIWGYQGTTTSITSTLSFLKDNFNISYEQARNFVNLENFPIPTTFHLIQRDIIFPSKEKAIKTNRKNLEDIYKYFQDVGQFFDLDQFKSADNFIEKYAKNRNK